MPIEITYRDDGGVPLKGRGILGKISPKTNHMMLYETPENQGTDLSALRLLRDRSLIWQPVRRLCRRGQTRGKRESGHIDRSRQEDGVDLDGSRMGRFTRNLTDSSFRINDALDWIREALCGETSSPITKAVK